MRWSSMPSKDGQLSAEELTKPEGDFQSGSEETVCRGKIQMKF